MSRGDPLRHARGGVDRLPGVAQARRAPGEQARRLDAGGHLGQHGLDHLLVTDRAAELLAVGRVADRVLHRRAGKADAAGGDADAPRAERRERDLQPLPLLAKPVGRRHARALEDELRAHRVADPHLPLVAGHPEAGRVALDGEGGDPLAAFARSTVAKTIVTSASAPFVIQIFVPSRR